MRLERILIFESACYLRIDTSRLCIQIRNETPRFVALIDIAAVMIDSAQVVITGGTLQALADFDIPILITNQKHQPAAMLHPIGGHVATVARQRAQANAPQQFSEKIWAKIVSDKIFNQYRLLEFTEQTTAVARLKRLAITVKQGDPENHEAQAAQAYWPELFDRKFRREKQGADDKLNSALNFGYTVVRANCTLRSTRGTKRNLRCRS